MKGCPLAFLRDVLSGKKKTFKVNELKLADVPRYPEISVKNLHPDVI